MTKPIRATDADISAGVFQLDRLPTEQLFPAMQTICNELFGVRLFSVLLWSPERQEILRVYSSNHDLYPLGIWKPMGRTPWGDKLLKGGEPVKCHDEAELRWAFPDADLLVSMDCIANLSAPVLADGQVLGVVSISERSGGYRDDDLALFHRLAQALRPAMEAERARHADAFSL